MADCDDGNACTDDSCDATDGCANADDDDNACDDADACTTGDACVSGDCVTSGTLDCDDLESCTDDSCDAASGCVNAHDDANTCSDADACTTGDACVAGGCVTSGALDCNDLNTCTDDSCDASAGCVNTNNSNACTDANACTTNDDCVAGECVGSARDCDDDLACTADSCDAVSGDCVHADAGEHVLLSEVIVTPTNAESVEIYNPTSAPVDLDDYLLADFTTYYQVTDGTATSNTADFLVGFPAVSIAACDRLVVALHRASLFQAEIGFLPDYELLTPTQVGTASDDATVANMENGFGRDVSGLQSLTDSSEMLVLFTPDAMDPWVYDVDYVTWGSDTTVRVDKTGLDTYFPDTPVAEQDTLGTAHAANGSFHRCDDAETGELEPLPAGNGLDDRDDETSEPFSSTWHTAAADSLGDADATCP